ncbi:uncharacterized protein LOC62_02G002645 [Vanrija pseudolonga]|uniref:Uncharacterized protein n=1 Tax=Vanrija pseudolonga TaxID=143232 RepID=A0AAF1BK29_9TREE|nr:hypothetical protein LOC62_02G002645 [Vanrija pseudolonga]
MQRAAVSTLAIAGLGTAYLTYESRRLARLYPVQGAKSYHSTDAVLAATDLPERIRRKFDPALNHYVYATIPLPPAAKRIAANPLDSFVRAFYETWTLRVEAWAVSKSAYYLDHVAKLRKTAPERLDAVSAFGNSEVGPHADSHPAAIAAGLFPVLQRAPSTVVYFLIPPLRPQQAIDGGSQELAAVPVGNSLELSYGCAVAKDPEAPFARLAYEGHLFYMRFLIDRGARRLERWIAEDARA